MRELTVFNNISLDGYFTDAHNDLGWAYAGSDDPEFIAFTNQNASGGGAMVFGRVTYDMMAGFWPTPAAAERMPIVADRMNSGEKIVFSRTLKAATWNNTRLIHGDPVTEMRKIKEEQGPGMVIMGSGSIIAPLAQAGLIDTYQVVVNPVILGAGRTMFDGVQHQVRLSLAGARTFKNGKVFLTYKPTR